MHAPQRDDLSSSKLAECPHVQGEVTFLHKLLIFIHHPGVEEAEVESWAKGSPPMGFAPILL